MKATKLKATMSHAAALGSCTLFLLCSGIASAQQATAPADPETQASNASSSAGFLQEVIVTAEKRAQPLQDVPMSITAVTNAALQNLGASTLADIARAVPGLRSSAGPGQNIINIRGISSAGGSAPTVGFYIDDTPVPNGTGNGYDPDPVLFDLARVEVLEGPQGTLYGASSMGGTVRYITEQPDLQNLRCDPEGDGFVYRGRRPEQRIRRHDQRAIELDHRHQGERDLPQ